MSPAAKKKAGKRATRKPVAPNPAIVVPAPETVSQVVERTREVRKMLDRMQKGFRLQEENLADPALRELIYTTIVLDVLRMTKQSPKELLKEARERRKTLGQFTTAPKPAAKRTPQQEAREVRRRWRELHGLEISEDTGSEKP